MRHFRKLSGLLFLLLLSVTSCRTYQWSGWSTVNCTNSFLGGTTQCTVAFTSAKNFNWTASSTVSGVTIQPSSGAATAGKSSGDIQVTLPSDACSGSLGSYNGSLNFTDDALGWQVSFTIVASGGGSCTLKI